MKDPFERRERPRRARRCCSRSPRRSLVVVVRARVPDRRSRIVGVVLTLPLIIMLHEAGHFVDRQATGMKVTEFFVGFGPRIWSFQRGETEYGVKAVLARRLLQASSA